MSMVRRIIEYCTTAPSRSIQKGFSDSDWAGFRSTRKSTSGTVFLVPGGAVSRRSKKYPCVALSSCEAEYIAMCLEARESIWISRLFCDLRNQDEPQVASLGVDNDGSIDTAENRSMYHFNIHADL